MSSQEQFSLFALEKQEPTGWDGYAIAPCGCVYRYYRLSAVPGWPAGYQVERVGSVPCDLCPVQAWISTGEFVTSWVPVEVSR